MHSDTEISIFNFHDFSPFFLTIQVRSINRARDEKLIETKVSAIRLHSFPFKAWQVETRKVLLARIGRNRPTGACPQMVTHAIRGPKQDLGIFLGRTRVAVSPRRK